MESLESTWCILFQAINIIHMLFEIGPGVTQRPFRIEKLAWIAAHFWGDCQEHEGSENLFPRFMNNPFRVGGLNFWARDVTVTLDGRNLGCKRTWILKTPPKGKGETSSKPPIFAFKILVLSLHRRMETILANQKTFMCHRYWENRTSQDVSHLVGR